MTYEKATRPQRHLQARHQGSHRTRSIVSDYDQWTLVAGLVIAISFGLMFVIGAVMF